MTTPGAIETAIIATAQAFNSTGWQEQLEDGLPPIVLNSSSIVNLFTSQARVIEGSGNTMYTDKYWITLTAAHLFHDKTLEESEITKVEIARVGNLPKTGVVVLPVGSWGYATALETGIDIAVIVFPAQKHQKLDEMFDTSMMTEQDIYFNRELPENIYHTLSFPAVTLRYPISSTAGHLTSFAPQDETTFILGGSPCACGSSGAGVFVEIEGRAKYVGLITGTHRLYPGPIESTVVTRISSLGKDGFDELVKQAVKDYESKMQE